MRSVSHKLKDEKELNGELLKLVNRIKTTQDGSAIMIDDAKDEYNIQYYKNWELFLGAIVLISFSVKILKTPIPVN
jgi:hypothetical protein